MIMAQSCASKRSNTSNPSSASRTRLKLLEQNSQRKREVGRGTEHRLRAYNSGNHAPLRRGSNVHIGRISWRLAVWVRCNYFKKMIVWYRSLELLCVSSTTALPR